ncbi:MAG: TonB-dependent receptor [Ferruginibacter sp.]
MTLKKLLPLLIALVAIPFLINAQVTTSSISGVIQNKSGELLAGSTIELTHIPTGTKYKTSSRKDGRYDLVNLIPGGPYALNISYVGYTAVTEPALVLALGENTRYDVSLESTSTVLSTVVVAASGGAGISAKRKTGASTSISRAQINALPTLSRSLQDYTRLTPQANGNSFGGVSNRFNNITIDGAVNNDVFGLSGSGTPGGQAATTPISLDAIQEAQVVLAPYDVSYGNFTGAGINGITRSGTNKFEGSVYYFVRNENTIGKDPITRIKSTAFSDKQYGARIGGPIIKNKLFFFVSGELARKDQPTIYNAGENSSLLTKAEAQKLTDTLNIKYKYDVGTSDVFAAQTQSDKLFGRLDWNVTQKHHLTIRHNYIKAFDDNISRSPTLFRFGNNTYRFNNSQNITVAELRSTFNKTLSNNLIVGRHKIRDFRTTLGSPFPSVEINQGAGIVQLGSERSSTANELDQDILEVTDNLKIFKGKNTFTIGTHNEFFKFRNLFINNLNGRWRFNSLADFYNNIPKNFDVTYSANKTADTRPDAKFKAAQLGFYLQDEIQTSPNFRLTLGLRVDMPIINTKPARNPVVDSTYNGLYNTQNIPNRQLLWSPRVGFNYDPEGDRSIIIRGGAGVFTGRVPFVWISNQFSNTGLLLKTTSQSGVANINGGNGFNPAIDQSSIGTGASSFEANVIDEKFKIPQVARFNLATDVKLFGGINLTLETILSKTINNVFYQNVNLKPSVGFVDPAYNNGFDKRIAFGSSTATRNINPLITRAIYLTNTSKGYSLNIGATLNKTWKHFFGQLAYNYNSSTDINSGASSTALSNWEFVQVVGDPNNAGLSISNYELRHRITGVFSTNFSFAKHFKTSVALFYEGNSGQPFTYVVNGDLNSDNQFGNDLVYVPNNPGEIKFVDQLNSAGTVVSTAAQQSAAFETFIQNDKYLTKRRGQYAERNGRSTPFEHVIDGRIAQDLYVKVGERKHSVQVTFDVFNLTNLINKDWGRKYSVTNQAYNLLTTINRTSGPFIGKGYNFTTASSQTPWGINFSSRWQGQIGFRYTFD